MTAQANHNVTQILMAIGAGDPRAAEDLWPLVYEELRRLAHQRMANEPPGQTIQATALVHEAYLRLVGEQDIKWENRAHFFGAAARAMRQILVDRARRRRTIKHGGDRARVNLDSLQIASDDESLDQVLAMDEALNRLDEIDSRKGRIVMLRYFAGLTIAQTASALGLSPTTVKDEWHFARAWLYHEMTSGDEPSARNLAPPAGTFQGRPGMRPGAAHLVCL